MGSDEPSGIPAARVSEASQLADELTRRGLADALPVLVLIGGASGMSLADMGRTEMVIERAVLPAVIAVGAAVVDGGTDAGVMRAAGVARHLLKASFPLIGVAGADTVQGEGSTPSSGQPLEPNHSLFVVVPGRTWGDEAPWIFRVGQLVAGSRPVVTVLLNGGKVAWKEIEESLRLNQRVIVVGGTGRTADELASASSGDSSDRASSAYDSGLVDVVDVSEPERLRALLEAALRGRPDPQAATAAATEPA